MLTHEGEETGFCSKVGWNWVGLETFVLEAGDSYYFESTKPHRFRNPFDAPARLISAATPANFLKKEASARFCESPKLHFATT